MKWKFFAGYCLIAGFVALKLGAPLVSVMAGLALACAWNAFKKRGLKAL